MSVILGSLEAAIEFARLLPDHVLESADLANDNDGEVSFEWYRGRGNTIVAAVAVDRTVAWAALIGSHEDHARMPLEQAASAITSNFNLGSAMIPANE